MAIRPSAIFQTTFRQYSNGIWILDWKCPQCQKNRQNVQFHLTFYYSKLGTKILFWNVWIQNPTVLFPLRRDGASAPLIWLSVSLTYCLFTSYWNKLNDQTKCFVSFMRFGLSLKTFFKKIISLQNKFALKKCTSNILKT